MGDDLRFEMLGPLCAWRGPDRLDLGPGKQRSVLAVLLLHAGRPVSTSAIIDAVWPDDPPENGPNVVQKYIAGLRRVLEPDRSPRTPGRLIELTDAGYALRCPRDSLDAEVFRAHVARGRRLGAEGGPELRAALDLWRGEALAGLQGLVFDSARTRLAEERAEAFEAYAQLELEAGRHSALVPELMRLTEEFPLREELRYLLILALYRSGRQAEALSAYHDTSHHLMEQFGVQPGSRLQELHQRILRSELEDKNAPPGALSPPSVLFLPAPPVAAPRQWQVLAAAAAIPLLTCGLGSWSVIAYHAGRRRSRALALAAAGYFALTACFMIALSLADEETVGPLDFLAILSLVAAMFGGATHAAVLASTPQQPPVHQVLRDQARIIAGHYPEIAAELGIGRPDLPRLYNDGGLVDINAAPEHVLAALPGITHEQARLIVTDRAHRGPFTSVTDLVTRGLVPATTATSLQTTLITMPPSPPDELQPSSG